MPGAGRGREHGAGAGDDGAVSAGPPASPAGGSRGCSGGGDSRSAARGGDRAAPRSESDSSLGPRHGHEGSWAVLKTHTGSSCLERTPAPQNPSLQPSAAYRMEAWGLGAWP